jgi:hypothetical protein
MRMAAISLPMSPSLAETTARPGGASVVSVLDPITIALTAIVFALPGTSVRGAAMVSPWVQDMGAFYCRGVNSWITRRRPPTCCRRDCGCTYAIPIWEISLWQLISSVTWRRGGPVAITGAKVKGSGGEGRLIIAWGRSAPLGAEGVTVRLEGGGDGHGLGAGSGWEFPGSIGDEGCGGSKSGVFPSVGMVVVVMASIDSRASSAEDVPEADHCPLMARASIANVASRIAEYSSSEYGYSSEIWRALFMVVGVDVMVQIFHLFRLLFIFPPPSALGLHS